MNNMNNNNNNNNNTLYLQRIKQKKPNNGMIENILSARLTCASLETKQHQIENMLEEDVEIEVLK